MLVRVIVALVLWAGLAACGVSSTITVWRMVDQVNAQLPHDKRFGHIGWWPGKAFTFYEEYDRHFPDSPRRRQLRLLSIAGFILAGGLFVDLYPILR